MDLRKELERLLCDWRTRKQAEKPIRALFPLDDILPTKSIPLLARFHSEASETASASDISSFLNRSKEWTRIYASEVFDIISGYNAMISAREPPKTRAPKTKRVLPQDQYIEVFKVGSSSTKRLKTNTSQSQLQSQSQSLEPSFTVFSGPASAVFSQSESQGSSIKRPSSPAISTSKRVRREPLGELQLNK